MGQFIGPVCAVDYPGDVAGLRAWFPTDEACRDYLEWLRWPDGFVCPHCGASASSRGSAGRYRCRGCRKQVSVLSGTVFHKTRIPLTVWFEAIWHVAVPKSGVNASHLYRVLPIGSYQSAWTMLAKLRHVMGQAESRPLRGTVEIDEAFFGGVHRGIKGRGALGKALVAGAVEVTSHGFGRARMSVIANAKTQTLRQFVRGNVTLGSLVITDGLVSYPGALDGYEHTAISVRGSGRWAHESLPGVHRVFSQAKRMIEGTYQGAGSAQHLQEYLDEYVFRFNHRTSKSRGLVFYRLLQRAVTAQPMTYRQLVRVPTPKLIHPTGVQRPRRQPGSLNTTPLTHPWRRPQAPTDGDLNG